MLLTGKKNSSQNSEIRSQNLLSSAFRPLYSGFTLIEVMVSVAILSIGLILIMNSFIRSVTAMDLSEDYFRAGLLLEEKIYEVHNADIEEGVLEGIFTDFDKRFSWQLDVIRLEDIPISKVDLGVLWNRGNKQQNMSVLVYLH